MKTSLTATVIIPTSIDRGPTLRLAVDSVLRQTVSDLEIFIIGDGAAEETCAVARELADTDPRVRFFEHPKHPRRGEPYRHAALQEARGRIVCYLCDRDLYLPDHIEEMARLLTHADFACGPSVKIRENGEAIGGVAVDVSNRRDRRLLAAGIFHSTPLSFGAHTLDAYHRLPGGWTETPKGIYTDVYFWQKFLQQKDYTCVTGMTPTVLYFPRGSHPGWSTGERYQELRVWHERLTKPTELEAIRRELNAGIYRTYLKKCRFLRHRWLILQMNVLWYRLRCRRAR